MASTVKQTSVFCLILDQNSLLLEEALTRVTAEIEQALGYLA